MLPLLALIALVGIAGTLAAPFVAAAPAPARVHLTFAIGIAPLILGALGYFVPVLTRSAAPPPRVLAAPFAALAAGVVAVAYFAAPAAWPLAYLAAAVIELAAVGAVLAWMARRARASIGAPHPCVRWYLAAAACLAAALLAVLVMPYAPAQYVALKRLHLHLNLLGFVGLTALGTLQVLVPTAAGAADPRAAARLDADLRWALAGTVLVAAGAAWLPLAAAVGLFFWLSLAIRIARDWFTLYPGRLLAWHGAPPSLGAALAGFTVMLVLGALHGGGTLDPRDAVLAFILAFLLPLVTGALTYLAPVWLRPGAQTPWHESVRAALGHYAGLRAGLFVAGGILAGFGSAAGTALAALGLALFVVQGVRAVALMRP
ncbi:MAG: hypothetical protein U1F45_04775 [Burkholderiales bacterium]